MGRLATLRRRIEQLQKQCPADRPGRWVVPVVEYDSSVPGDLERVTGETKDRARAAGWTPAAGIVGLFLPRNGRGDVVDVDDETDGEGQ